MKNLCQLKNVVICLLAAMLPAQAFAADDLELYTYKQPLKTA